MTPNPSDPCFPLSAVTVADYANSDPAVVKSGRVKKAVANAVQQEGESALGLQPSLCCLHVLLSSGKLLFLKLRKFMPFSAGSEPVLLCRLSSVKEFRQEVLQKARIAESLLVPKMERLGCHLLLEAENNMIKVFISLLPHTKLQITLLTGKVLCRGSKVVIVLSNVLQGGLGRVLLFIWWIL